MTAPMRGRCLVINNKDFDQQAVTAPVGHPKLADRNGSEFDVMNIEKVFQQLSFHCEIKTNLTGQVTSAIL